VDLDATCPAQPDALTDLDWLPTVCSLVGVPLPGGLPLDGENMSDVWWGTARQRSQPLCWEWLFSLVGDPAYALLQVAIRDGRWKLFCGPNGGDVELYDVVADAAERASVANEHADVVDELRTKAIDWQRSLPPSRARKATARK
jgi:arylsulfatase A-like enzyme